MILRKIFLPAAVSFLIFLPSCFVAANIFAGNVRAADNLGLSQACIDAPDSTYCKNQVADNPNTNDDPAKKLIKKITNIVAYVGGAMAVIIMIYAGLRYVVSVGNSEKTATALKTIIYTAIGLAVIIAARTIIVFAINHIT
jgi:hypothetical protein